MKDCSNLGIGRTTGFNYLKEKEVDEYLKKRRETIRKETEEMISSNYQKAMEGLSQMMEDTGNDETRIKAIDIFLKYHNKSIKEGSGSDKGIGDEDVETINYWQSNKI